MLAAFDNLPIFQYQDYIRVADRGEAMGDHEGCTAFEEFVEGFLDEALGACVHTRRGFVQDEDARVGKRGARNREQLALSL